MATRRAVANGNWSATGTWNGGVLPGNGDTVYANGFNVTINQDINIGGANNPTVNAGSFVSGQWYEVLFVGTTSWTGIGAASNTAGTIFLATGVGSGTGNARALATLTTAANTPAGATGGGGSFTMSSPFAITADLRAGTTTCLSVTGATALTLDGLRVVGGSAAGAHGCNYAGTTTCTLENGTFTGGSNGTAIALNNASSGTVNVSASCTFTGGTTGPAFNNASSGTVNVSASCTFTGGGSGTAIALNNASSGTVNVSASCTFTGGSASSSHCFQNTSTGSVNVSAPCTFMAGNNVTCFALNSILTGTVIISQGTFTASAFSSAMGVGNTAADVRLSGDFLDHWSGWKAVSGTKWRLGTAPTLGQTRFALAGTTDSYFTMYGADNGSFGNPIAANVRSGVSYGGGNLTGSCAVPTAGSVALGVPVDATTGTAVLTPEAVWGHASRTITEGGITAADVWNAATRTITGGTITTLTNAPTVPSVVEIRQEMDSNSTKLANLDATVSSRLASSAYSAAPTTAQIATAVEGSLLNEADGQAVLNAIVGAISNTNLSEVSLVAAIRSDIERAGGKLDAVPTAAANASAVWGTASKTVTGGTVDTLTNSPSVPSAASIAAATRTELAVELARVDASVSSRMAASEASKLDAVKTKTDALNTERLANVATTAIVGNLIAQANS